MEPQGSFVWYELITPDPDAAARYYADVVGWRIADSGMPGMDYRIATAPDGDSVAGLMRKPDEMPGGAVWLGYVAVDDVDATAGAIAGDGGSVHMPAMTVAGVGRMAMLADPQHAPFYVMRGESGEASRAFRAGGDATPGHAVWNELTAPDPDAAIAFYARHFGWRHEGGMPMGDLGEYRFLHAGDTGFGAVMGNVPGGRPGWQYYFMVPDIDYATRRVEAGGGKAIQGPRAIPGGSFALVAEDPQGARFGLVGPRTN